MTLSPRSVGRYDAIAGRSMPGTVRSATLAMAIRAPVLPAEMIAEAVPSQTASMASRMLD
ncbi:hypothetical protein D3C83_283950 [compost metagenome]